jgi:hypothetical protein
MCIYIEEVLYSIELELNSGFVSVRCELIFELSWQGDRRNRAWDWFSKALVDHELRETKELTIQEGVTIQQCTGLIGNF